MYLQYKTNSTWIVSELMSDIVAIFTGTTNVASLSASCDKVNTQILANTISSNWTVYDPMVGDVDYTKVLSAPDYAGATTKYLKIRWRTNYGPSFVSYTSWNNSTHTGTDATYETQLAGGNTPNMVTTSALVLYILVSTEYFHIIPYQNGSMLAITHGNELVRDAGFTDYLNNANSKCNFMQGYAQSGGGGSMYSYIPRCKNPVASGEIANSTIGILYLAGCSYSGSSITGYAPTYAHQNINNINPGLVVYPAYAAIQTGYYSSGSLYSKVKSLYILGSTSAPSISILDEIIIGGVTYVAVMYSHNHFYEYYNGFIVAGPGPLPLVLVPKG